MTHARDTVDLSNYQPAENEFAHLSLRDLLDARDLYHAHLAHHPNVVATAIGRYRIRKEDSWPNATPHRHGTGVRRFDNSEIRPYSWPCVTVFVSQWVDPGKFEDPSQMVPRTLFLPDGRRVPVCVIEAPRESVTDVEARDLRYPLNNIGPGFPVIADVQGMRYTATIGCLVSDGHRVYAMTNRHVVGEAGSPILSRLDGREQQIGASAAMQLTRRPFSEVYPNFAGRDTYVNLDIGLIDIDDLDRWTTRVRGLPALGPMADFDGSNLSLALVGCQVRGVGAAGGDMLGEVHGLFYRYKTRGGSEYVADLYIGPRTNPPSGNPEFATLPGDSGTLWMLEPLKQSPNGNGDAREAEVLLPLAIQWGRNMLRSGGPARPQGFALATLLARACDLLDVDVIRDWNVDQVDTWGAMGHFAIAARSSYALSDRFPNLVQLVRNNAGIISHDDATLAAGDFTGMGSAAFVPMADVPDFFWKPRVAKQGFDRPGEGPNHFADMDQKGPGGKTLLDLTVDPANIDTARWESFYDSVTDMLSGEPIAPEHRGLLPFRVWQIFDAMVRFASDGDAARFVCAAGVLTHYLGDACQPLHISYLHDGDPLRAFDYTYTKGKKQGQSERRPLGMGVHSAYEDAMVHEYRVQILAALKKTARVGASEAVGTGKEAAERTVELMRNTFKAIAPADLVQAYIDVGHGGKACSDALWNAFGQETMQVMQAGAHLVGVLWESAWSLGDGETKVKSLAALDETAAMDIVKDPQFLPSKTIADIGAELGAAVTAPSPA